MDIEAERKKFEAWWLDELGTCRCVFKRVGEAYFDTHVYCAWQAWQAAVVRSEAVDDGKARLVTEGLEDEG